MAARRHPDIHSAEALLNRERSGVIVAQAARYPQVSFDSGVGNSFSNSRQGAGRQNGSIGVTAELLLYDFGKTPAAIGAAKSNETAADVQVDAVTERIAAETSAKYLASLRATALRQASQDYLESLTRLHAIISLREESGVSDRADVLLADVILNGARAGLLAAETNERAARSSISSAIGIDPPVLQPVARPLSRIDKALNVHRLESHPEILSAKQQAVSARYELAAEKASIYPRLALQGSYGVDPYDPSSHGGSLMVTLKGNLYQGGAQGARVQAASSNEVAALTQVESIRMQNEARFKVAEQDAAGAASRKEIVEQQLNDAYASRDLFFEQYTLGKRTLSELLTAEGSIYQAQVAQIEAEHDGYNAVLQKAIALGIVFRSLGSSRSET
ncbi:TolC family protein [Neorhizobium sp. T786]|uniref:TolC family protein n=1 Tax=Pseudorhizobium xiangyangii TaxID=2883104 RepID=UPI001CFFB626|nr:TolC family protein [Neorhizobium xiangyangii]MCB5205376.1 TolC family protein [Neorhizobium xiangyangii]